MLKLSVLIENTASSDDFAAEHGLSFLLEFGDAVILFDVGKSGDFLLNAARMGLDISRVTDIVLSHGHHDHAGGLARALAHIRSVKNNNDLPLFTAHPGVLLARRRALSAPEGGKDIGIPPDGRKALETWPTRYSKEPVAIRESIVFLGEIPRKYPDLCSLTGEALESGEFAPDTLPDDTGLAFITPQGLIIVAGCSHSGIVNIIAHAKAVTGVSTVRAVYGGLHFIDMAEPVKARVSEALLAENLEELGACHCTDHGLDAFPGQIRLAAGVVHVALGEEPTRA